jgi:hypothetical protein
MLWYYKLYLLNNNIFITPFLPKNGTNNDLDILIIYNSYLMVIYFQLTPTEIPKL